MDSFKNELAALAGVGGILGAGIVCTKLLFLGQRPKPHGIPILVCWGAASVGVVVASAWYLNRRLCMEDSTEDSKDEDPTTSLQDAANKPIEISILDKVMPILDQIRFKQDENYKKAESTESRGNDIMTALKEIAAISERSNAALKNVEVLLKRRSESIARRSTESD